MMLVALALFFGLAQCKKNFEQNTGENEDKKVFITLNVNQGNGSRLDVDPPHVVFQYGDKIYVASNGVYVGFLEYNGTNFDGEISNATEGQPLYFYLLGNVTPSETLTSGSTTSCSVVISDQTANKPVIACNKSNENFGTTNTFTSTLRNKCALVKFNVTTSSTVATCITGFNNKVTVDFSNNTLTHSQENNGVITLPAGNGEKRAILLPQDAMESGTEGSAYSVNGVYTGTRGAVPAITNNGYLTEGIEVVISTVNVVHDYVDLGLPSGILWATCNVGADAPEEYGDYFAWGETKPKDYYFVSNYQYCNGDEKLTKYCDNSNYGYNGFTDDLTTLLPEDDAATVNWDNDWRMPTKEEWQELYSNTTFTWTTQNGVNGRCFTASNGNSLFLPAAGGYNGSSLSAAGSYGYYWSSSLCAGSPGGALCFRFYSDGYGMGGYTRCYGFTVRPVCSSRQN